MKTLIIILSIVVCVTMVCALISCRGSDFPETSSSYEFVGSSVLESKTDNGDAVTDHRSDTAVAASEELPKESKTYVITYTSKLLDESFVGKEWTYGVEFNSIDIVSGDTIMAELSLGPTLVLYAIEHDDSFDDYGSITVEFADLAIGEEQTIVGIVKVRENRGRYSGSIATWEFTVTCKRNSL